MLEKYKDKTILIVGGGTSTLDRKWENLDYDYIWTCNDFYLEDRLLQVPIDLYLLGYTTELTNERLLGKIKQDKPTVVFEPIHYRGKQTTKEFKEFCKDTRLEVKGIEIPLLLDKDDTAAKSGAVFRLINLALQSEAKTIYFVGFDGFNKDFTNKHAFTKQVGLKSTDTRRDWQGTRYAYKEVFEEAFEYLAHFPKSKYTLQNLGEGLEYNLGTEISKEHFPLKKELYEKLK